MIELTWYKTMFDLKAEHFRGFVGYGWWIIEPALYVLCLYFVFGYGLRQGTGDFVLFIFIGTVFWKWYSSSAQIACIIFNRHKNLISQVYIPKPILIVSFLISNTIKFFVIFILLLVVVWMYGKPPSWYYLYLPLVIGVSLALISAVSFLLSSVGPFMPDLAMLVMNLNVILLFISGVFFDFHKMGGAFTQMIQFNPFALIIDAYRDILLHGKAPALLPLLYISAISAIVFYFALRIIKRFDRVYPKVINE